MKYRKKPVVIDAWTAMEIWLAAKNDWKRMPEEVSKDAGNWIFGSDYISIYTLEGNMRAELGDMIIRGVKGEFYPCKPDIFIATYEQVPT